LGGCGEKIVADALGVGGGVGFWAEGNGEIGEWYASGEITGAVLGAGGFAATTGGTIGGTAAAKIGVGAGVEMIGFDTVGADDMETGEIAIGDFGKTGTGAVGAGVGVGNIAFGTGFSIGFCGIGSALMGDWGLLTVPCVCVSIPCTDGTRLSQTFPFPETTLSSAVETGIFCAVEGGGVGMSS
jgi:hypothetical protein